MADINEEDGMISDPAEFAKREAERGKEAPEEKPEEPKEEPKPKVEPKVEEKPVEPKKDAEPPVRGERPAKIEPNSAEKALFAQIKELREEIKNLKVPVTAKEEKAVDVALDKALAEIAEKRNLDPEGLSEIANALREDILKNVGKPSELPADIQEKLKDLEDLKADKEKRDSDQKVKEDTMRFESEWGTLLTDIRRQYPNAGPAELAEAKKQMDEIAHTADFRKYDLDYVLFKNKSVFDTLLKLAKGSKSGEGESKQIVDDDVDELEVDLDPDNMNPQTMKVYEERRLKREQQAAQSAKK